MKKISGLAKRLKACLSEHEDSDELRLIELKWFHVALWVPVCIAMLVGGAIFVSESFWAKEACFTSDCFEYLYKEFFIPLWIAALSLPLVGLVASNHRSAQTVKQISTSLAQTQATNKNNMFNNYLKHKEAFRSSFTDFKALSFDNNMLEVVFFDVDDLYFLVYEFNFIHDFTSDFRVDESSRILKVLGELQKIIPNTGKSLKKKDSSKIDDLAVTNLALKLGIQKVIVSDGRTIQTISDSAIKCDDRPELLYSCVLVTEKLLKFASSPYYMRRINTQDSISLSFDDKDYTKYAKS